MGMSLRGLWRHPDFLKLWAGQTVSLFGLSVTGLALPLVAVLTLDATPVQMGLLSAAGYAPFLLVGLVAGACVDRMRRRPILIAADLGRALLLASIPVAALVDALRMEQLYAVGFTVGLLTVFFDVAYQSYLPALVPRERLIEGNSKFEASHSLAQIAGPGLGGLLVQLLSAATAIALDAASYLVSAIFLAAIRTPEPRPERHADRSLPREIGEGLRLVVGNPLMRGIAGCTATSNLFGSALTAVYVLYATRELGLGPAQLGVTFAAFGPGGLLGAVLAARLARRFGLGPALTGSLALGSLSWLVVLFAGGPPVLAASLLATANALATVGGTVYNVNQVSLRQAITPDRLQGRMNATMRFLVWGVIPIGALLGGVIGDALGLRAAIATGAVGTLLAPLWLLLTPVYAVRRAPTLASPHAGVETAC